MAGHKRRLPTTVGLFRHHIKLWVAVALGVVLVLLLPAALRRSTRLLMGWDFGAAVYLASAFVVIRGFDLKRVQVRAEQADEGALLLLVLVVAAAVASLGAIVAELGAVRASHLGERVSFALAAVTTVLSWALIHTIFAFHYAHEFYRGPGDCGSGLVFPNDDWPEYWDFVYFSFVIGMTFQVSDVQVSSKHLRRVVMAHGIISFFFSVAILALTVNLGANLI